MLKFKIIKTFFLFFLLSSLLCVCHAQPNKFIRVLILPEATSLRLKIIGAYEIIDLSQNKAFYRGKDLRATVTLYKNKLLLGDAETYSAKILIKTEEPEALLVNGQRFRGDLALIKKGRNTFSAINYIDIEDYIKGILYHETSHYWPMEALKAQAIACRAYALYQQQNSLTLDYDVTRDIYSQVYGGRYAERERTSRAVLQTKGLVLTFQDKIFPTYFHATCAGHTEDASVLWDIDLAPLKGVACEFCRQSPHFKWHVVLTLAEIKEKLSDAGHNVSRINDILILSRDNSGRVLDLKIIMGEKDKKISAKDFRNVIGPNVIRSTNFTVRVIEGDSVFEGLGWGHGVGLCQWGAYFMAKKGYAAEEILRYYYPQAKLSSLD